MLIILLIGFLDCVDMQKGNFEAIEFYAGQQRMVKLAKGLNLPTASMDYLYDDGDNKSRNNSMDMNTSAGFTFLNLSYCFDKSFNFQDGVLGNSNFNDLIFFNGDFKKFCYSKVILELMDCHDSSKTALKPGWPVLWCFKLGLAISWR